MAKQDSVSGACLCGEVQFSVALPTRFNAHCHCTMCQRGHGAGYVTWIGVAETQLTFEQGAELLAHFPSSEHGTRSFCSRCGSSLFCRSTRHADQVDIVVANLSGELDRQPELHVYFSDRAGWVDVGDGLPRLGGDSGMEPLG